MARRLSSRDKGRARIAKRQGQPSFIGDGGATVYLEDLSPVDYEVAPGDYSHWPGDSGSDSSFDSGSSE